MKNVIGILTGVIIIISLSFSGCSGDSKSKNKTETENLEAEHGEHSRDIHGEGEGEESGTRLGLNEVYDEVRNGTHMVLKYDAATKAFTGTVENISDETLDRVRVEVHLSNGIELGPTTQVDLEPGEKREVRLVAESDGFDSWSTHAEVGSGEHAHSQEGESSHEGEGEHSHEGEGEGGHEHN